MDRHLFSDGAYYISVENKNTAQSILKEISYLFKLPYNNEKVPFPYYSFKSETACDYVFLFVF